MARESAERRARSYADRDSGDARRREEEEEDLESASTRFAAPSSSSPRPDSDATSAGATCLSASRNSGKASSSVGAAVACESAASRAERVDEVEALIGVFSVPIKRRIEGGAWSKKGKKEKKKKKKSSLTSSLSHVSLAQLFPFPPLHLLLQSRSSAASFLPRASEPRHNQQPLSSSQWAPAGVASRRG